MGDGDDAERLRREDDEWSDEQTRSESPGNLGSASIVVVTTRARTYPTTAASFFACKVAVVGGAEVEGKPGTFAPAGAAIYVLNLGGAVPPEGTYMEATYVPNRWVMRYD